MEEDGEDAVGTLFQEPEGYLQKEKPPTFESFKLDDGRVISLRLVGNNPLWGHLLWNGAQRVSRYLQQPHIAQTLVQERTVLELGAGAGLPSLVCAAGGAKHIVVTDYPDTELVQNLRHNIESNAHCISQHCVAEGYLWGADAAALTRHVPAGKFDLLILADLLFNHSEHAKLARTVEMLLARSRDARALVFFTPYRPWLLHKDLEFFSTVTGDRVDDEISSTNAEASDPDDQSGKAKLEARKLLEEQVEHVMFENDPGDERLRRTVFGYEMFWADLQERP